MPFLIALATAVLLTGVARWVGLVVGLVDRPGDGLKIHDRPVPVLGGAAVVVSALGAGFALGGEPDAWVATAVAVGFVVGLSDDIRPLGPWLRLALLAAAGGVLSAALPLDLLGPLAVPATVLVLVACANSVNILDGQDGLVGGLTGVAALGLAGVAAVGGSPGGVVLGLALAGALCGFLVWNRPPARVFLGNGGAYAVGAALAALAILAVEGAGSWQALLAAGLCLGPFVFELLFTVARRLGAGARVAGGDRGHSYDLVALRVGRVRSTVIFWGLGAVAAGLGLLVAVLPPAPALAVVVAAGLSAAAWGHRLWTGGRRAHARSA